MLQLMLSMPAMRTRAFVAIAVAAASGILCRLLMARLELGAADFTSAILAARDLVAHRNPYSTSFQLYPLPAAFFGLPFLWVRPETAAGLFYGISSGLLAFGITRQSYHGLLIFLAYPYWAGMLTAQWPPLIMAGALFPFLLPAAITKPQIGLPVALTHLNRKGVIGCVLLLLASFVVMPHWLPLWLGQIHHYSRFIPLLVLPGPLLAAALLRYRDRDAWLLFLAACMPQRWFYDSFILWLIPKTRRQILLTILLSWVPGIWRWYHMPNSFNQVGRWTVIWIYIPMLAVVLLRSTRAWNEVPVPVAQHAKT
jgi:hypothetical protein